MLGKLFRHEWKSFYKMPVIVSLCILVITILGIFSMFSPFWTGDSDILIPFRVLYVMFYIMVLIAGPITVMILLAVRYYKNLYTDEAYLTHTLPVTPREILLSKIFVSVLWTLIVGAIVVFSIVSLVSSALIAADIRFDSADFRYAMEEIGYFFRQIIGTSKIGYFIYSLVIIPSGCVFSILTIYSSISLGQLFTRHKILGAVIWYIAQYSILQIVTSLIVNVPVMLIGMADTYDMYLTTRSTFQVSMGASLVLYIGGSIGLYFLTEYLVRKKLNLD